MFRYVVVDKNGKFRNTQKGASFLKMRLNYIIILMTSRFTLSQP